MQLQVLQWVERGTHFLIYWLVVFDEWNERLTPALHVAVGTLQKGVVIRSCNCAPVEIGDELMSF